MGRCVEAEEGWEGEVWYLSKTPGQVFKMCWPLPDCINEGFH